MKVMSGCCNECPISSKVVVKQVFSGLAASILFLSQSNLVRIFTLFAYSWFQKIKILHEKNRISLVHLVAHKHLVDLIRLF